MQPNIIFREQLLIKGLSGRGYETKNVWSAFDDSFNSAPFEKGSGDGYEIRFFDGDSSVDTENDVHVGFLTESTQNDGVFSTLALPATEYAVFYVIVANGYDSENANMSKWLEDNSKQFRQRQLNGNNYIVECYNARFQNGVVEIWIPLERK